MIEILNSFEKYLEEKGYSKLTPSGKPSTTHDYSQRRIPAIISREGITMNRLIKDISMVVSKYGSVASNVRKNQIFYIYNKKDVQRSLFS